MKKLFVRVLAVVALTIAAAMQTTAQQSFSYQAVIRDSKGELVTNQKVGLKFSLLNGGKAYYTETQTTDVNEYGNISVEIGKGTQVGDGKFSDVPWNTLDVTLRVEVDPTGGKNYQLLGETKISPAPYAMYATQGGGGAIANGASKDNGNLFEVTDREGRPVFAVTNDGIVVYVDDTDPDSDKARRSGFIVTGRTASKNGDGDLFAVTAEGTKVYVDDPDSQNDKARRSGFIVTGRTATKNSDGDLFAVNDEGTKVYVDATEEDKARRSGFIVTGRTATKDANADIFAVDAATTTVYVDDSDSRGDKARRSGFIVTGRTATKDSKIVDINGDRTNLNTTAFTVTEHNDELGTVQSMISVNTSNDGQTQLMVHTDIAMEDEVIEVNDAPTQGEYAITVTDSIWFTPAIADDYNFSPEFNQLMAIYGEGEYAPAVSVVVGNDNYHLEIPTLFFDGEGNPTSNAKKAAVVVFDTPDDEVYGEGVFIIRAFEPVANKTIEFGLMNADGEFVKITATINSDEGKPFDLPVGDYEGGKTINVGGGYFGSTIILEAIPDKGKIFAGWEMEVSEPGDDNITVEYTAYRIDYPFNGAPMIDEMLFQDESLQIPPVFTAPVLYVSSNISSRYSHGFSADKPLRSIDAAVSKISWLADEKLDWTIKVVDKVYGAQTIPEGIQFATGIDQPGSDNIITIPLTDFVNSIRLTGISEDAQIDGSWWYSNDENKWYYGAGVGNPVTSNPALSILSPVPVTIDNLAIKRGHADMGGGIFTCEGANVTLADDVKITGNDAQFGGGLSVNMNACVTIADGVEIVGNTAQFGGGIFLNEGANVTIADGVEIVGNTAESGGGVYLHNGAKFYMTGGVINQNAAESENSMGGGICATANSLIVIGGSAVIGDKTIADASKISGDACANRAKMGGGIYSMGALYLGYKLKDDATELTAANLVEDGESSVTIQGNYASVYGGGGVLYSNVEENAAFMVYKTDVLNNRTDESYGAGVMVASLNSNNKIDNCHINGNYNVGGGAGLNISGNLTISNTEFSGNKVGYEESAGGAGVAVGEGTVFMDKCIVHDNISESNGGGIYVNNGAMLYANDCEIYGNKATFYDGGGIYGFDGSIIVLNGNTVVGNAGAEQRPTADDADAEGFKGNVSGQNGAGIHSEGQLYIGYNVDEEFRPTPDNSSNVKICGNYSSSGSDYHGGGISDGRYSNEGEIMLMMHNATVMHNAAGGSGNGVYIHNGTITVSGNTTFDEDNDVYLDNEKVVTVGALDESAAVNITIETIRVGTKVLEPANDGIELADYKERFTVNDLPDGFSINNNGVIVVDEINVGNGQYFESIAAAIDAINAMGDDTKTYTINIVSDLLDEPQIIECSTKIAEEIIIEGNSHKFDLGWDGRLTDYLTLIEEQDDLGTALTIATNVPVTIKNLVITGGCKRNGYGGGIFIGGEYYDGGVEQHLYAANVTLSEGVIVKQNYCIYGGGVAVSAGSTLTIESDAEISNNTSDYGGGGIYAESNGETNYVTVVMEGGTIKQNKCRSDSEGKLGGAGVLIYGAAAKFKMNDGSITENESQDYGGGVGVVWGAKFEMNDGSITKNKAETENNPDNSHGGGVFVMNSEFTFNGGTISNNTAIYGSGVCVFNYGDPTFTMSGSAKVDADNDVYLDDEKITIDKQLTYAGIVATITLNDYDEDVVVLQRKDGALSADDIAHFAVTPYDTGNGIKYYRVSEEGKLHEMTGSKAAPDAIGDIVFSDGSAMPYSDDLTLTDNQKHAAIAVIFDAEDKKGIALDQKSSTSQWCDSEANGFGKVGDATSETDGKANTEAIYALGDFGSEEDYYPPFEYAINYSAGGYTDWYVPAIYELETINGNKETINKAIDKTGKTQFGNDTYWSSSQDDENDNYVWLVDFTSYPFSTNLKKAGIHNYYYTRCARIFSSSDNDGVYWVKPNSTSTTETGNGTWANEFVFIQSAINAIIAENNPNGEYIIHINGTGNRDLDLSDCSGKAQKITFVGEGTESGIDNTILVADDNNNSGSLVVTFRYLSLKGKVKVVGNNSSVHISACTISSMSSGATVMEVNGGNVYLEGTTISGNNSNIEVNREDMEHSGRIYMYGDAKIENTTVAIDGYGWFVMEGGTISNSNSERSCVSVISENGRFFMHEDANVGNVFLNGGTAIFIDGDHELTSTGIVATIYPPSYNENTEVLRKQGGALTADDLAHFAVKPEAGNTTQWTIVQKDGDNTVGVLKKAEGSSTGYIGTKAPGADLAVGDIVFSDGSATAYAEGLTLDENQQAVAIAVIFYVGTDGDALGNRTLGIGKYNSTANGDNTDYMWANANTLGATNSEMQTTFADILSYTGTTKPDNGVPYVSYSYSGTEYITGDLNGSDNWGKVKEKDSNYEGNYPGFEWVDGYANRYNLPDNYKDGWYLPSAAELIMLWKNLYRNESDDTYTKKINTILETIGGTALKDEDHKIGSEYVYDYLTSNRTYEGDYISLTVGFETGAPCARGLNSVTGYVCAIREF